VVFSGNPGPDSEIPTSSLLIETGIIPAGAVFCALFTSTNTEQCPKGGLRANEDVPIWKFGGTWEGAPSQVNWQYNRSNTTSQNNSFCEYIPMLCSSLHRAIYWISYIAISEDTDLVYGDVESVHANRLKQLILGCPHWLGSEWRFWSPARLQRARIVRSIHPEASSSSQCLLDLYDSVLREEPSLAAQLFQTIGGVGSRNSCHCAVSAR
jgi:hypothetical protein